MQEKTLLYTDLVQNHASYILDRRHHYHAHPELSGQEVETCAQIKRDLEAIGITDITEMQTCHGLTATIHGGKPGKTVGLRADIDALCVREETGLPFASTNGNMHACGHDMHVAILLGAAKVLYETRETLCGDVRLIVQPAEELATGAKAMVDEGALDGVDAMYGNHVMGMFPSGQFGVPVGNAMACAHQFTIEVTGFAAHGSAPHDGIDAITAAALIVNALQQCVSRQNDPLNPLVVTVGTIQGGTRFNIIPNRVTMEGTVRTYSRGTEVEERMRTIIEKTAESVGARAELHYSYLVPPLINDDDQLNRLAREAVAKTLGAESLQYYAPMMGSEDFAFYGEKAPYVYTLIGLYNKEKGHCYSNHHEKFDGDESVLIRGATVMAQFAADYLGEG